MNEEQMRAEFEAWWANFQSEHDEWKFADKEAILFQAWQAALSAKSVPEGWKLVPIEPTDEMLDKGRDAGDFHIRHYDGIEKEGTPMYSLHKSYKAMIAAAPQAPTDDERVRVLVKDAARYRWILYNAEATDALWKYGIPSKIALTEKHISNAIDQAIASMSGEQK